MYLKISKLNYAGDTIVEVLIALVIIGTVLGGAFEISSLSLRTQLASSHRSQALQLAQTQLEELKAQVFTHPGYLTANPALMTLPTICMTSSSTVSVQMTSPPNCKFDSDGTPISTVAGFGFTVSINDSATTNHWSQIEVNVTWPADNSNNSTSGLIDSLSLYYDFDNGA